VRFRAGANFRQPWPFSAHVRNLSACTYHLSGADIQGISPLKMTEPRDKSRRSAFTDMVGAGVSEGRPGRARHTGALAGVRYAGYGYMQDARTIRREP
jgi:hypothetical protein